MRDLWQKSNVAVACCSPWIWWHIPARILFQGLGPCEDNLVLFPPLRTQAPKQSFFFYLFFAFLCAVHSFGSFDMLLCFFPYVWQIVMRHRAHLFVGSLDDSLILSAGKSMQNGKAAPGSNSTLQKPGIWARWEAFGFRDGLGGVYCKQFCQKSLFPPSLPPSLPPASSQWQFAPLLRRNYQRKDDGRAQSRAFI